VYHSDFDPGLPRVRAVISRTRWRQRKTAEGARKFAADIAKLTKTSATSLETNSVTDAQKKVIGLTTSLDDSVEEFVKQFEGEDMSDAQLAKEYLDWLNI
jgi:hypothetical protein